MTPRIPIPIRVLAPWLATALLVAATPDARATRELATDRPDVTESPVPVEPGRWQLEMDAIALTRHGAHARSARTFEGLVINLKRGLDARSDVQLLLAPLTLERPADASAFDAPTAWSLGLRGKRNLWGADGGTTAAALLPWFEWDTGAADRGLAWSAGMALPFGAELPGGFGAGLMLEGAAVAGAASDRVGEWTASATLGHEVHGPLAAYLEWVGTAASGQLDAPATLLSAGLTLRPSEDLQFDAGVRLALLRSEDDTVFLGLAVRR